MKSLKNEIKKIRRNYPDLPGDPGILKDPNLKWTGELELGNRNKRSEYQQFKNFLFNLEEKRVITSAILFSIILGVILLCWISTCFKESFNFFHFNLGAISCNHFEVKFYLVISMRNHKK